MNRKEATRPDRYVPPFYTPMGFLPKSRQVDLFISRKDPQSGKVTVVPEMTHFHDLKKPPVPTHKLLEDDWRAYRSFAYTNARMARVEKLMGEYYRYQNPPLSTPRAEADRRRSEIRQRRCQDCCITSHIPHRPPKTVIAGPFQQMLHAPKCARRRHRVGWQQLRQPASRGSQMGADRTGLLGPQKGYRLNSSFVDTAPSVESKNATVPPILQEALTHMHGSSMFADM